MNAHVRKCFRAPSDVPGEIYELDWKASDHSGDVWGTEIHVGGWIVRNKSRFHRKGKMRNSRVSGSSSCTSGALLISEACVCVSMPISPLKSYYVFPSGSEEVIVKLNHSRCSEPNRPFKNITRFPSPQRELTSLSSSPFENQPALQNSTICCCHPDAADAKSGFLKTGMMQSDVW